MRSSWRVQNAKDRIWLHLSEHRARNEAGLFTQFQQTRRREIAAMMRVRIDRGGDRYRGDQHPTWPQERSKLPQQLRGLRDMLDRFQGNDRVEEPRSKPGRSVSAAEDHSRMMVVSAGVLQCLDRDIASHHQFDSGNFSEDDAAIADAAGEVEHSPAVKLACGEVVPRQMKLKCLTPGDRLGFQCIRNDAFERGVRCLRHGASAEIRPLVSSQR